MKGRYELMDFLLSNCSTCSSMLPNLKNDRSETPLHLAAAHHGHGKDMHESVFSLLDMCTISIGRLKCGDCSMVLI